MDSWDIGTLKKTPIWVFYALSNYVGVFLCAVLMYIVARNPKRSISDIFVCGLASGCLSMSVTCGTQCILNLAANRFYGGNVACQIEAIAHISSVLTEFFCVMSISISTYRGVVHRQEIKQLTALKIVICIWLICTIITCLLSFISPVYLMSAGTYCFFSFSSLAIAGWLVPGLIIALTSMIVCHVLVMKYFTKLLPDAKTIKATVTKISGTSFQDLWIRQFQWRSTLFILALLTGWGFAAVTVIYEFAAGEATEWLVTAVGVGGVSFSWWVPLVFLYTSPSYRTIVGQRCKHYCNRELFKLKYIDEKYQEEPVLETIVE